MQLAMHMVTIEDLMPQGHFLRKLRQRWTYLLYTRKRHSFTAESSVVRLLTRWSS